MLIPRSIACAAVTVATAVAVALPAQAGLAAPAAIPADGPAAGRPVMVALPRTALAVDRTSSTPSTASTSSGEGSRTGAVSPVLADRAEDPDPDADAEDADDPVQVVDGEDAPEDDSDVLADGSGSSSASGARRDRTSGRWAQVAHPTGVQARMTGASRARVTWRSGVGGVLAQRFVVELRAGGSVLRTTTFSSARSATFWGLSPAKRYTVGVTAVAADGTRRSALGSVLRTPAAAKAKAPAARASKAASSAKAAVRQAKAARFG